MKPFFVLIVAVALICVAEQDEANTDLVGRAEVLLGKCGKTDKDDVYAYYDKSSDTLTIKGTGEMKDYDFNTLKTRLWHKYSMSMETVVFKEGVKSVGNFAFYGCSKMAKIVISNSVNYIGESACKQCFDLTTLDFDHGSTLKTIKTGAFKGSGLFDVYLPETLTEIGRDAFKACSMLSCVSLHTNVKKIGNSAFAFCRGLRKFMFEGTSVPKCDPNVFEDSITVNISVPEGYASDKLCELPVNKVKTIDQTCISTIDTLREEVAELDKKNTNWFETLQNATNDLGRKLGVTGDVGLGGIVIVVAWKLIEACCAPENSILMKRRKMAHDMWKLETEANQKKWMDKHEKAKKKELEDIKKGEQAKDNSGESPKEVSGASSNKGSRESPSHDCDKDSKKMQRTPSGQKNRQKKSEEYPEDAGGDKKVEMEDFAQG